MCYPEESCHVPCLSEGETVRPVIPESHCISNIVEDREWSSRRASDFMGPRSNKSALHPFPQIRKDTFGFQNKHVFSLLFFPWHFSDIWPLPQDICSLF